jgi:hypothetical protein
VAFVVFEIPGVARSLSSDEADALTQALYDRVKDEQSTAAYHLALPIDAEVQRPTRRGAIVLTPDERAELLAAMNAAGLGLETETRLWMLRDALHRAALRDEAAAHEPPPDSSP